MMYDVVIPCFNAGNKIIRAVESVLRQVIIPNKIFVVDDASDDNITKENLRLIVSKYFLVKVIYLDSNMGPSFARNAGISCCTSEFIAFLDSDDYWMPTLISTYKHVFNNFPYATFLSSQFALSPLDVETNQSPLDYDVISFKNLVFHNKIVTSSVILKSSFINGYLFDNNMRFSEDLDLWLRLFSSNKFILIKKPLVFRSYSVAGGNNLSNNLINMHLGVVKALSKHIISSSFSCSVIILFGIFYELFKFPLRLFRAIK